MDRLGATRASGAGTDVGGMMYQLNATIGAEQRALEREFGNVMLAERALQDQKDLLTREKAELDAAKRKLAADRDAFEAEIRAEWYEPSTRTTDVSALGGGGSGEPVETKRDEERTGDDGAVDTAAGGTAPSDAVVATTGDMDRRIKLNVGGVVFETRAAVLSRDRFSMLAALCRPHCAVEVGADGAYFIDRDWWIFRHVLTFLRTGSLPDKAQVLRELYVESAVYRLTGLREAIERKYASGKARTAKGALAETEAATRDELERRDQSVRHAALDFSTTRHPIPVADPFTFDSTRRSTAAAAASAVEWAQKARTYDSSLPGPLVQFTSADRAFDEDLAEIDDRLASVGLGPRVGVPSSLMTGGMATGFSDPAYGMKPAGYGGYPSGPAGYSGGLTPGYSGYPPAAGYQGAPSGAAFAPGGAYPSPYDVPYGAGAPYGSSAVYGGVGSGGYDAAPSYGGVPMGGGPSSFGMHGPSGAMLGPPGYSPAGYPGGMQGPQYGYGMGREARRMPSELPDPFGFTSRSDPVDTRRGFSAGYAGY